MTDTKSVTLEGLTGEQRAALKERLEALEEDERLALRKGCPAGGRHEIVEAYVQVVIPRDPERKRIPGRICRKCWLRDTYIDEGEHLLAP